MRVCYFIANSPHYLPTVLPLLKETGGLLLTSCRTVERHIRRYYEELGMEKNYPGKHYDVVYVRNVRYISRDLSSLQVNIVVHPSFSLHYFRGMDGLKHVQIFHGTSDKPFNFHRSLAHYDLIVVPGPKMKKDIEKRGLTDSSRIAVIGYPKIDSFLHSPFDREGFTERKGLDGTRKTVLYSPTWDDPDGYSSFSRCIVTILRNLKDVNIIIKPHPNILKYRPWQLFKAYIVKGKNAFFCTKSTSILPFMAVSDVLITDISSVAHEYLPFNRPIVFLNPKPGEVIPEEHIWIWHCGDVIVNRRDITRVVRDNLNNPEKYSAERQKALKEVFLDFDGESTRRFKEQINNLIRT